MPAFFLTISDCFRLQEARPLAFDAQILMLLALSFCANIYYISHDSRLIDNVQQLKPVFALVPWYFIVRLWRKLGLCQDAWSSAPLGILTALPAGICTFYQKDNFTAIHWIIVCTGFLSCVFAFYAAVLSGFGAKCVRYISCSRAVSAVESKSSSEACSGKSEDSASLGIVDPSSPTTACGPSAEQSSFSDDSLDVSNSEEQESVNMRPGTESALHDSPRAPKFPETYRSRSASLTYSESTDEYCEYSSSVEEIPEENVHHALARISKGACDRLLKGAKSFVTSAGNLSKSHSDSEIHGLEVNSASPRMSSSEYESSEEMCYAEETENFDLYRPGGYHPTVQGEIFNYRFVALEKIGWGECSIVWLAKDTLDDDKLVALKISRASVLHKNCAINEAHICTIMRDRLQRAGADANEVRLNSSCVMEMYDSFEHEGPNGVHFVSVLERLGPNLLSLMTLTGFRGLPQNIVRFIAKRILHGLTFLHDEINVSHTDVKPENILLVKEPTGEPVPLYLKYSVKVSDLGSGRIMDYSYPVSILQTREYRAPEVLMGCESIVNQAIDVWSLGCVIFELLTGDFLFDPKSLVDSSREQDLLQMNLIMQVCGAVPKHMLQCARYGGHFFRKGVYLQELLPSIQLKDVMVSSYNMNEREAESFCDFLLPMLEMDPSKRVRARDHTQHEWLQLTADQLNEELTLQGM